MFWVILVFKKENVTKLLSQFFCDKFPTPFDPQKNIIFLLIKISDVNALQCVDKTFDP